MNLLICNNLKVKGSLARGNVDTLSLFSTRCSVINLCSGFVLSLIVIIVVSTHIREWGHIVNNHSYIYHLILKLNTKSTFC